MIDSTMDRLTELQVSQKINEIPEALSVYFNQLVYDLKRKKQDITTLSLGEAFFKIPYFDFQRLDFDRGYHYSDTKGLPGLREKIANYYCKQYETSISEDNIIISAGSKMIIYMCMQAILNPNDEVLIHEPAWLSYKEQAHIVGAEVRSVPFFHGCEHFHKFITDKTRMIIINNPNNPAGRTYTKDELLNLYHLCHSHNIYLLIDEAYSDFVVDNSFTSIAKLVPNLKGVIVTNSLSKNMGMSGWRIGYAIADQPILSALIKLNQHLITCAPTILQQYVTEYFDDILSHTLIQVKDVVKKRNHIATKMSQLGLDYLPGSSTFYFFVKTDSYEGNIHDLALYLLLEKGIAVVPGSAYGKSTSQFLRISIGTESTERIEKALLKLRETLTGPKINAADVRLKMKQFKLSEFS
ncbi:MAG: hypothetical protein ACD_60C00009G0013 [uncultured bacterium]|nr:MAG: hypothetical protein ACD_60C00009G0013 [uncultured bacterium]